MCIQHTQIYQVVFIRKRISKRGKGYKIHCTRLLTSCHHLTFGSMQWADELASYLNLNIHKWVYPDWYVKYVCTYACMYALVLPSASCRRDIKFPSFFFQKQIPPSSASVSRGLLRHQTAEPSIWTQKEKSLFPEELNFIYRWSAASLDFFGVALLPSQFYYLWQKNSLSQQMFMDLC